jgi:hypothetical protein
LHRYLWQFDFLWNNRQMNDGWNFFAQVSGELVEKAQFGWSLQAGIGVQRYQWRRAGDTTYGNVSKTNATGREGTALPKVRIAHRCSRLNPN